MEDRYRLQSASVVRGLLLLFLGVNLCACAGPTTPFGAIHDVMFAKKVKPPLKEPKTIAEDGFFNPDNSSKSKIEFYPERQLLHKSTDFKVKITDPNGIPKDAKIKVYYENYDVSETFLGSALHIVNKDKTELTLEYNHLRLHAEKPNHVRFVYQRLPNSGYIIADYLAPYCSFNDKNQIRTLGSFKPPKYILKFIEHWSLYHNVNPTLLAGLVAQESSFDTRAVSWAKAIGLTQVTNLAAQDVSKTNGEYKTWPRSSAIEKYPATIVKAMITSGKITPKDDYRLDPEKSVRGGLVYLKHLEEYWRRTKNYQVLQESFGDPELVMTEVILASYNSGAARVKSAIKKKGVNYLTSKNLNEARKYVRNINSYCYHFANNDKGVKK